MALVTTKTAKQVICSFCHGPLTVEIVKKKEVYSHLAKVTTSHDAIPVPEHIKGLPARLHYEAPRLSVAHEFIKNLEKKLEWVGPHTIMGPTGMETYTVEVAVDAADSQRVVVIAHESGMDTSGKLQRQSSHTVRTQEVEGEPNETKSTRAKGAGQSVPRASKASTPEAREVGSWWACGNCKRHIKGGKEWHLARPNATACKDYYQKGGA